MDTRRRIVKLELNVQPEKVFLVSWHGERFTKGAGVEITREEFERLAELPGAVVIKLAYSDCDAV